MRGHRILRWAVFSLITPISLFAQSRPFAAAPLSIMRGFSNIHTANSPNFLELIGGEQTSCASSFVFSFWLYPPSC